MRQEETKTKAMHRGLRPSQVSLELSLIPPHPHILCSHCMSVHVSVAAVLLRPACISVFFSIGNNCRDCRIGCTDRWCDRMMHLRVDTRRRPIRIWCA